MGAFTNWTYSNFHELNLDWLIKTVKELSSEWAQYHADWESWKNDTDSAYQSLYNYVMDYFNNLDLTEEVSDKINKMVTDGTFDAILEPLLEGYQNQLYILESRVDNLAQTITPGGTSGDAELSDIRVDAIGQTYDTAGNSVRGQVTDLIEVLTYENTMDFCDLFNPEDGTHNGITYTKNGNSYSVVGRNTAVSSIASHHELYRGALLSTMKVGGEYKLVCNSPSGNMQLAFYCYNSNYSTRLGAWWINTERVIKIPEGTVNLIIWLYTETRVDINEVITPKILSNWGKSLKSRSITPYIKTDSSGNYVDFNDITETGLYLMDTGLRKINAPDSNEINTLEVYNVNDGTFIHQTAYSITRTTTANIINNKYDRYHNTIGWLSWDRVSTGGNVNYNTFNYEVHSDTYNVTATPQITSVTDLYLQPSGNTSDRTSDIMTMLQTNKVCKLGVGDYYISTGIDMPDGTAIIGAGRGTRLILDESVSNGYAISIGSYCIVQDLRISGKVTGDLPYEEYSVGNRDAIVEIGDYQNFTDPATFSSNYSKLSNLWIDNFNGSGIKAYRNDGGGSLLANNIDIFRCGIGVNIELFSEFHAFNNIRTRWCVYGCIMNGGNNLFSNCHFDTCIHLLKIDNSLGNLINDSHSSFTNCTFCHANNNQGNAIEVINVKNGLVFSNCQVFYGKIILTDTDGVSINNFNFGSNEQIVLTRCKAINISNSLFGTVPDISETSVTGFIFSNNMTRNGSIINR